MSNGMIVVPVGAICGRFQPFHLGHWEYLLAAKQRCDRLIIGITNPDARSYMKTAESAHRHTVDANPFSYFERMEIILNAVRSEGVDCGKIAIVPFPITDPEYMDCYIPTNAVMFVTVYDDWGLRRVKELRGAGYKVEVLWTRTDADRLTSGAQIRSAIRSASEWRGLVVKSTVRTIEEILARKGSI